MLMLAGHRIRVESDEHEEVRRLATLIRGMSVDVGQQIVEFVEWHLERLRRGQGGE